MAKASLNKIVQSTNQRYDIKPVNLVFAHKSEPFDKFAEKCVQECDTAVFFFFKFGKKQNDVFKQTIEQVRITAVIQDQNLKDFESLIDAGYLPVAVLQSRVLTNSIKVGMLNDFASMGEVFGGVVVEANNLLNESRSLLNLPQKKRCEEVWISS